MAVNRSRSMNTSLLKGTMEGKYVELRPHTEVDYSLSGHHITVQNKMMNSLFNGYGHGETDQKVPTGSM